MGARIGPNAVIQLIVALRQRGDTDVLARLFREAGREDWLEHPPQAMVEASDAARVHQILRRLLPDGQAEAALVEAGRLTADYLLAHRIPRLAQFVLRLAPPAPSAKLLLGAISAHAWTFAGGGRFEATAVDGARIAIHDNPLCEGARSATPICFWHAAVLERLFQRLVSRMSRVREVECCARGDPCCRFEIRWRPSAAAETNLSAHEMSHSLDAPDIVVM